MVEGYAVECGYSQAFSIDASNESDVTVVKAQNGSFQCMSVTVCSESSDIRLKLLTYIVYLEV